MRKLEQIQVNKLISAYGGVGSIIETNTNGSLLVLPYDKWECFKDNRLNNASTAKDPRLLNFVNNYGYIHVNRLVLIPTPDLSGRVYKAGANDIQQTVSTKFFPEWYYCPRCRKLKKYNDWKHSWGVKFNDNNSFSTNSPACCFCSEMRGNGYRRVLLQQVRFVMASLESGDIKDVPFDKLWNTVPQNGVWNTDGDPSKELKYKTLPNGDGLNAIYINNSTTGKNINLSLIERNYIVNNGKAYKMIVKGSNSLYFPNIVRSLYIPTIEGDNLQYNTEEELNLSEFTYLIDDNNYINGMIVMDDLVVKRTDMSSRFISRISRIERLKETSVLLSYSRIEKGGETREWYDLNNNRVETMRTAIRRPFSDNFNHPTWMPVVEDYGEGILFEVEYEKLDEVDVEEFVHTFCHIIMKEMEFQCGYPLTSLKEKIYFDNENKRAGFIIYTIAGSEGSYGGLVSLTDNDKIIKLIERGTERAKNCPNDPICINETESHCFACLDLPETSCIKFNKSLNRKRFIEKYFPKEQNPEHSEDNKYNTISERPQGLIL